MQIKTIKRIINKKLTEWLLSIEDEQLRKDVRENLLLSGGSITCLLQGLPVNDYDIYIKDMDVLVRLAMYYSPGCVLDGRNKEKYLLDHYTDKYRDISVAKEKLISNLAADMSEQTVRLKNLQPDQVKLNIESVGITRAKDKDSDKKYQVAFLSQNAISLTDDIQIVLRFHGDNEAIHKTFDFIHATNYFTFKEGLVTNLAAMECILTKQLRYQGSHYPLTSIIRMKKFLKRGWTINAGEILKIMFQISELNLKNPEVMEEQLIGVDIAYFALLIAALRNQPADQYHELTSNYLNELIDKIFNEYDTDLDDEDKNEE